MSAIADFRLIEISKLKELEKVAKPVKGLFGRVKDAYFAYFDKNSLRLREYEWSGFVFGTLLVFLEGKEILLMKSCFDDLSESITKSRDSACFIFTEEHRINYGKKLDPANFIETELKKYYNDFNEINDENAGKAMLDGIEVLYENINRITADKVIVFSIY